VNEFSYLWRGCVALRGKFWPLARLLKLTSLSKPRTPRKPIDCQQPLLGYNRKQYNGLSSVMPIHTNPTWRMQPLPMSNRDVGKRMPASGAHAVRVAWCAGENS
jgi:hypothetical protein